MEEGWGVYIASTQNLTVTHNLPNSVGQTWFKMCTLGFSVGPTISTQWDRCARIREKPHLDETDHMNSVRPISVIGKQRVGQANSVGPIAHFGETETLRKGNREFALRTRWDQSLIWLDRNVTKGNREFAIPSR